MNNLDAEADRRLILDGTYYDLDDNPSAPKRFARFAFFGLALLLIGLGFAVD
jgi:hypothetical protein